MLVLIWGVCIVDIDTIDWNRVSIDGVCRGFSLDQSAGED